MGLRVPTLGEDRVTEMAEALRVPAAGCAAVLYFQICAYLAVLV